MNTKFFILSSMAGLLLAPMVATAADSPLATQMEVVGSAFKAFRTEKDPDKGAATARDAQQATLKATAILPATVTKIADPAAQAKAAAEYRLMLGKLYVAFCEVEQAYLSKDMEQVAKVLESLKTMKKDGHTKFMEEED
jgi:hypothetical protein